MGDAIKRVTLDRKRGELFGHGCSRVSGAVLGLDRGCNEASDGTAKAISVSE